MPNNLQQTSLFSQHEDRKHRTTYTQKVSFAQFKASGKGETEKEKVLALLRQQPPLTSRQIAGILGVERTNITRTLRDLIDEGKARVAMLDKCPTTGKKVQHYSLPDWHK